MKWLLSLLLVVLTLASSNGKIYSQCELARELLAIGFPRASLPTWVCIALKESGLNSGLTQYRRSPDATYYGLFQINDARWCKCEKDGGECQIHCYRLIKDNVYWSAQCAMHIYRIYGYNYWGSYRRHCRRSPAHLESCNL